MPMINYEPQRIDADELNTALELDSVFLVNPDGTVELTGDFAPEVTGEQGPVDPTVGNEPDRWEFFSRGYSGQHAYAGPEMHASEQFSGGLARDVLANPGVYALVGVTYLCDPEYCSFYDPATETCPEGSHIESWAVLRRRDVEERHDASH